MLTRWNTPPAFSAARSWRSNTVGANASLYRSMPPSGSGSTAIAVIPNGTYRHSRVRRSVRSNVVGIDRFRISAITSLLAAVDRLDAQPVQDHRLDPRQLGRDPLLQLLGLGVRDPIDRGEQHGVAGS